MTQGEKITQLILDYFTCLGKSDDDYELKGEWQFDLEEKYNALYEACREILGLPSLGEIQAMEVPFSEIETMIKSHAVLIGKLTSDLIFTTGQIIINHLDYPIEKKAILMAGIATQKENVPLYQELKIFNQSVKTHESTIKP